MQKGGYGSFVATIRELSSSLVIALFIFISEIVLVGAGAARSTSPSILPRLPSSALRLPILFIEHGHSVPSLRSGDRNLGGGDSNSIFGSDKDMTLAEFGE